MYSLHNVILSLLLISYSTECRPYLNLDQINEATERAKNLNSNNYTPYVPPCKPVTPPCYVCTQPPTHVPKPCSKPVTRYKFDSERYIGNGCSTINPCNQNIQKCTTRNPCTQPDGNECQCSGHEHKNCPNLLDRKNKNNIKNHLQLSQSPIEVPKNAGNYFTTTKI